MNEEEQEDTTFDGVRQKCGVALTSETVEIYSECCGCGDVLSEEKALELTRALMSHFGIKEDLSN